MESTVFGVEGRDKDTIVEEVVLSKMKRTQSLLLLTIVILFLFTIFSVVGVIWLSVEVANIDDDQTLTLERSGYWIEKEPLPYGRSDHHVVAVGDLIYIIGGANSSDTVVSDVSIYDTVLGTYSDGPSLPTPLYRFASGYDALNRRIYVLGGLVEFDGDARNRIYVLDLETGEWMTGPRLPAHRSDACGAYVDGRLFIMGGYSLGYTEILGTVDRLDIETGVWTAVTAMPTPRGDCKAEVMNGKIIVVGGFYDPTGQYIPDSFRNEVELYDPISDTWKQLAPMKNARGDKAIAVLSDNHLLALGGETHNRGSHTDVATHHVEEYLMAEDIWVDRAPLPYATFRTGAAYVDGAVFVFGGHRTCAIEADIRDCVETDTLQVYFDVE